MDPTDFDERAVLSYLGLPPDYEPSPGNSTIQFLRKHLSQLPPHILCKFSSITTPKLRTILIPIRNRRLRYINTHPAELDFTSARGRWPELWEGRERRGREEGEEEKQWVEQEFLQGERKHIGKLGSLLGDYEEEREAERIRTIRRELAETTSVPEEESESEESDEADVVEEENDEEKRRYFERLIRERFIYGLLPGIDYDRVDYDEGLDVDDDRETQDRWFDED
ncbi:hypothetical protein P691DRAFT_802404 [Macrolepiota fuliginosa MF-IS2]|uniref:CCD97-like C-terminal domain-containing protein n=1 Tax=Macrolepiota fuliginosa MF-IS2 TaxID=1400762 RepID=A0A9P6C9E4_9AGAR|nr:hypothetical protein P691DRAFT_802404 [Macrolepiota fuliginosa MF-IS2]